MAGIDPVDAGILYLLRNDARNRTTTEIGDVLDLAPSAVGTRINDLAAQEIICGYDLRVKLPVKTLKRIRAVVS